MGCGASRASKAVEPVKASSNPAVAESPAALSGRDPLRAAAAAGDAAPLQVAQPSAEAQLPGAVEADSATGLCCTPTCGAARPPPPEADSATDNQRSRNGVAHAQRVGDNPGKIAAFYNVGSVQIREGSFGAVRSATDKTTGAIRWVETIAKAKMTRLGEDRVAEAVAVMKMVDHPNISKFFETFEDLRNSYLVTESCDGGGLFDRVVESESFTEAQAAHLMQPILRTACYMHELQVCHRGLRPENFQFATKDPVDDPRNCLKLVGFALARRCGPDQVLETKEEDKRLGGKAGTAHYTAPEVLADRYGLPSDLWSCGAIMHVLLCGHPPFLGNTASDLEKKIQLGGVSFGEAAWGSISEDAKDLIRHLMVKDPLTRYTAQQALSHIWIAEKAPQASHEPLQAGFIDKLRDFHAQNGLKKVALTVIAGQLDDAKIHELRGVFAALDVNGEGLLTAGNLKAGLEKAGLTEIPPDLQQIMEAVDTDGNGAIDYTEFLAAMLDQRQLVQEDAYWAAFRTFDKNLDGKISMVELLEVISTGSPEDVKKAKELMGEVDTNGDGEIDFPEFMAMMLGQHKPE